MKTKTNKDGAARAAIGIRASLQEITRRNKNKLTKEAGDFRFGSDCRHEHVYKSRCLKCLRVVLSLLGLALAAGSAQAQGYDTYVGNAGLVTTVQIEQARQEHAQALAFRNMSIADRWDSTEAGSLARRWSDAGGGSIAARWSDAGAGHGSIAQRWENK